MKVIEAENISFSYGGETVLDSVSFSADKGDFTGILGPNGSGKTTLIKILLGLIRQQSGTVKLFNMDISKFNLWNKIGYLEQKNTPPSLMPLTAFEVARLGLLSTKPSPKIFNKEDNQKTNDIMHTTGCYSYKDKLFYELSGGQQQRVLLARTLVNKPAILILDEPSTALDSSSRETFFDLISHLNKESQTTVLLITHDIAEVGKYVNKFLILDKQVIFSGDKHSFCESKKVTEYFGPYTQHIMDHLHGNGCCPFGEHK